MNTICVANNYNHVVNTIEEVVVGFGFCFSLLVTDVNPMVKLLTTIVHSTNFDLIELISIVFLFLHFKYLRKRQQFITIKIIWFYQWTSIQFTFETSYFFFFKFTIWEFGFSIHKILFILHQVFVIFGFCSLSLPEWYMYEINY